jgi:hypothetical protein
MAGGADAFDAIPAGALRQGGLPAGAAGQGSGKQAGNEGGSENGKQQPDHGGPPHRAYLLLACFRAGRWQVKRQQ